MEKDVESTKNMILTDKGCLKHLFAGQDPKHLPSMT